ILVTNEIVGAIKIERLVSLARHCDLKVVVDHRDNAEALSEAALRKGLVLDVLIEVNVGQNRCGVDPGQPALELAEVIARCRGLRLRGLQGYEGFLMFVKELGSREQQVHVAMQKLMETRDLLVKAGHPVEILTGGGTGTHRITGVYPGMTEVQAGSYVMMDSTYREVEGVEFECALTVLATVMSRPSRERAIVDAGFKTLSTDQGMPRFKDVQGVEYQPGGDEHGRVLLHSPSRELKLGDKVEIIPSHCDTTINLHDEYLCHRNGRLEAVWPIAGRGKIR
ncbi:MAG: alanine racemase, partial [Deltaproteobacteria bacterium]|nr:alanine racemase [Deltaproteobacteria bacterium]